MRQTATPTASPKILMNEYNFLFRRFLMASVKKLLIMSRHLGVIQDAE
jgi:hypothetical protein